MAALTAAVSARRTFASLVQQAASACEAACGEGADECRQVNARAMTANMELGQMQAKLAQTEAIANQVSDVQTAQAQSYRVFESNKDHRSQFTVPILPSNHPDHLSKGDVISGTKGLYKCVKNCW